MKHVTNYFFYLLLCLSLVLPQATFAQDAEPTDRPFPGAVATTDVEPTDRPFPGSAATATERSFPVTSTSVTSTSDEVDTEETAIPAIDAETTPELLLADIQATADAAMAQITQLEAERNSLLTELEASRTDNGATTFALVIIGVGVLLALGVFFGLRRSAE